MFGELGTTKASRSTAIDKGSTPVRLPGSKKKAVTVSSHRRHLKHLSSKLQQVQA